MVDATKPDDTAEQEQRSLEIPEFALVVAPAAHGDWRLAALVKEAGKLDFYVRSIRARWPFILARPARSNRQNDQPFRPEDLSPAGTTPARKLVVNWGWEPVDETTEQLRFFVRRKGPEWLGSVRALKVRLGLKEQPPPRREFSVRVRSNRLDWRSRAGPRETDTNPNAGGK